MGCIFNKQKRSRSKIQQQEEKVEIINSQANFPSETSKLQGEQIYHIKQPASESRVFELQVEQQIISKPFIIDNIPSLGNEPLQIKESHDVKKVVLPNPEPQSQLNNQYQLPQDDLENPLQSFIPLNSKKSEFGNEMLNVPPEVNIPLNQSDNDIEKAIQQNYQDNQDILDDQLQKMLQESENDFAIEQAKRQEEEDKINQIIMQSELYDQSDNSPDFLNQLEQQSQKLKDIVHPLKPIANRNFGVEWDSKGQIKSDTSQYTVFKKEEKQTPPQPNVTEYTVKKKKKGGAEPTRGNINPKLEPIVQVKTVQYQEKKKPALQEQIIQELGPYDFNIKPSPNTTNQGWITPLNQQDAVVEDLSIDHKNNKIDLDELHAFLEDGTLFSNAPKKQQYNYGGGLNDNQGKGNYQYGQLSTNILDFD
ncbi:UNKNOWN [Stylonychia lemnae]|uniref:Uncharacterized protein n=1 Tax=Stylonychia lemnae TaxID=5949 RepID=A0A078AZD7_STYLE|nr:UNKNOWN [Stylonychia lemnae]|eukprot:CDW86178.1 UNKNOWN [Stylonychia lemnae]